MTYIVGMALLFIGLFMYDKRNPIWTAVGLLGLGIMFYDIYKVIS